MSKRHKDGSVNIVIPARIGSNRIKLKNLRLLDDKPLVTHAIEVAKKFKLADGVYLNSDGDIFKRIAEENNINFYKRNPELATTESLIDDYLYDFMTSNYSDYLLLLNPNPGSALRIAPKIGPAKRILDSRGRVLFHLSAITLQYLPLPHAAWV